MVKYAKPQAREVIQERLRSLSPEAHAVKSSFVYQNLKEVLADVRRQQTIETVLSYTAILKWHEVNIASLERDFGDTEFEYAPVQGEDFLPRAEYDVILVPLYGYCRGNYRLGHGGGWYDLLLRSQPSSLKIGVGLALQQINFAPEPHDIPMDVIVTEQKKNYTIR